MKAGMDLIDFLSMSFRLTVKKTENILTKYLL
jgi:hypothetical protein